MLVPRGSKWILYPMSLPESSEAIILSPKKTHNNREGRGQPRHSPDTVGKAWRFVVLRAGRFFFLGSWGLEM